MGELPLLRIFLQYQWSDNAVIAKPHIGQPFIASYFHQYRLMSFGCVMNPIDGDSRQKIRNFESHLLEDKGKDAVHFKAVSSPPLLYNLFIQGCPIQ